MASSSPSTQATVTLNVATLSNAIAVALQQQASGPSVSPSTSQTQVILNNAQPGSSSSQAQPGATPRSASSILPSFLKRRARVASEKPSVDRSKRKVMQTWDRDIVCLPPSKHPCTKISYPRGKYRASLAASGLIGKIRLSSTMTVEEVEQEVRSVFHIPMHGRNDFPFVFLQPTGAGSRTLTVPSVSSSFSWTAQQVSKLGGGKQAIYILAEDELELPVNEQSENDESSEEELGKNKDHLEKKEETTKPKEYHRSDVDNKAIGRDVSYSVYSDLIDLTAMSSSESESVHSGDDILPNPSISLVSLGDKRLPVKKVDLIVAKHAMQQHQVKVLNAVDDEDHQYLHVRRSHLLSDTIRSFSKASFKVNKILKVVLIGESSVDEGGPRREFFHLAMMAVFSSSGLFVGWPSNVIPVHNVEAVSTNQYYIIGKLIATCLVQGGQPPTCFSAAVADFLVYDEIRCEPCIEDIPDYTLRQVLHVENTDDLRKMVDDDLGFRFDCGYTKPTCQISLLDRHSLIKALWLHHVFFLPHAELEQLRKGLRETLQLEMFICVYPEEMHSFLVATTDYNVTSTYLLEAFSVVYSPQGSNKRTCEEAIILHWTDYIQECSNKDSKVSLSDVLQFFTGSTKLPAAGFNGTPTIKFTDEPILPKASTCDLSMFPRLFEPNSRCMQITLTHAHTH